MLAPYLLALLHAAGSTAPSEAGGQALVVVALPPAPTHAVTEALNRLRGEAIAVGFEVRLVTAATETRSPAELEGISAGLRPAAVVAISRPGDAANAPQALDVWFLDRGSGKASVAHLDAGDVADGSERAEVVVAVRAVDFIRARMFDTLAARHVEPPPPPPLPPPNRPPPRRFDLALGLAVLGTTTGFTPSLAPQIAVAFRPVPWLRLGVVAFGLGSNPERDTLAGSVKLQQRYAGAWAGLLGPIWHRLQPVIELGGGEHWLVASGKGKGVNVGLTRTLSSPAASAAAGVLVELAPYLALEVRGGVLWLQERVDVCATADSCLGSIGRPLWWSSLLLGARL